MALSDLTSSQLQQLIQLVKEKEDLLKKLAAVDRSLTALDAGEVDNGASAPTKRRKRRGALKEKLLAALTAAGKNGLSVKELAAKLNAKPGSVAVWFYTTGKKIKGLKKIAPARYSYSGE